MKIAIIASSFPLSDSAEVTFPATYQLAKALKQIGHDVIVCTIGGKDQVPLLETTVCGIPVYSARFDDDARKTAFDGPPTFNVFSWQMSRARLAATAFKDILQEFQPDIIESQEFNGLSYFLAAQRQFPLLIRCYGPMGHLMRGGFTGTYPVADIELVDAMELAPIALADGVIAICNDIAGRLSQLSGRALSDWEIIRSPFQLPKPRTEYGADPDAPSIFFWGRVDRLKGADLVLQAFINLAKKYPKLRLNVAGKETVEEGDTEPFAERMRTKLRELGLIDQAKFHGFLPQEQIERLAAQSTICVFPSRYETCCYAALEAIAYGGVVVAAKAGGLPDYHSHGTSAWLVETDNADALTDGIDRVLGDPGMRAHLLANAKQFITEACDPTTIAKRSVESYETAIARYKGNQQQQASSGSSGERAFALFANHLLKALDDQPIWAQYPSAPDTAQPSNVSVKQALKLLLRIGSK